MNGIGKTFLKKNRIMTIKFPPQNQIGQSLGLAMALVMMSLGVITMMTRFYFIP